MRHFLLFCTTTWYRSSGSLCSRLDSNSLELLVCVPESGSKKELQHFTYPKNKNKIYTFFFLEHFLEQF